MTSLNIRQLRSLGAVAPGTLLHSGHTKGGAPFFITTEDDRIRSNVWGIAAEHNGDVRLFLSDEHKSTADEGRLVTRLEIIQAEREAHEECRWPDTTDVYDPDCTGHRDETGRIAHDGDTCPVHEG